MGLGLNLYGSIFEYAVDEFSMKHEAFIESKCKSKQRCTRKCASHAILWIVTQYIYRSLYSFPFKCLKKNLQIKM